MITKSFIASLSGSLLVLMYTYAAISKLLMYNAFRFEFLGHVLIRNYTGIIAWTFPVSELPIVCLIIMSGTHQISLRSDIGLLIFFTLYIIWMFRFYSSAPCSCGGVLSEMSWKPRLLFNLFFIGIGLTPLMYSREPNAGGHR
ncbi:MAG: MauE/DoxX family redox-associated membrane protein [Flavitalea sp.]